MTYGDFTLESIEENSAFKPELRNFLAKLSLLCRRSGC